MLDASALVALGEEGEDDEDVAEESLPSKNDFNDCTHSSSSLVRSVVSFSSTVGRMEAITACENPSSFFIASLVSRLCSSSAACTAASSLRFERSSSVRARASWTRVRRRKSSFSSNTVCVRAAAAVAAAAEDDDDDDDVRKEIDNKVC